MVSKQKLIKVSKEPCDKENLYAAINIHSLQVAMSVLRNSDFRLWCYFAKNRHNYGFELSRKACGKWGIKKDAYDNAIASLIEKNYLVPVRENSNYYIFNELPDNYRSMTFEDDDSEEDVNKKEKFDFLHCDVDKVKRKAEEKTIVNWEKEGNKQNANSNSANTVLKKNREVYDTAICPTKDSYEEIISDLEKEKHQYELDYPDCLEF